MCVNTCNEPPNLMVAIFIPSATISLPRCSRTTAVPLIHRRITPSSWIIHTGAQGIHLVIIAMSIECKHHVCVIGLLTSCMVKSSSGACRLREGIHPLASSCKNYPRMTCREANTLTSAKFWTRDTYRVSSFPWALGRGL